MSLWGAQRDSNPCADLHRVVCYRYTMGTMRCSLYRLFVVASIHPREKLGHSHLCMILASDGSGACPTVALA